MEEKVEVIVKYHGSLDSLREMGVQVDTLYGGFAILLLGESQVALLKDMEQIEYMEIPRQFYYEQVDVAESACFPSLLVRDDGGEGVLLAILDSGIMLQNPEFLDDEGRTRVRFLYDEGQRRVWTKEAIDELLEEEDAVLPGADISGHGTAVAGIAAGSITGLAKGAELLIVKLASQSPEGFPGTTTIMRGATFAMDKALEENKPLVMNLSFGNTYGAHDGSSILEQYLDVLCQRGKTSIVVGAGNEGNTGGHVYTTGRERETIPFLVGAYETSLSVQIWYAGEDDYEFSLTAPDGTSIRLEQEISTGRYLVAYPGVVAYITYEESSPYRTKQELFVELFAEDGYLTQGEWQVWINPGEVKVGGIDLYLPSGEARSTSTRFVQATPDKTITIPATAGRVISVGAYDTRYGSYATFSGRGYVLRGEREEDVYEVKPDLAAPGVGITAPGIYGGMVTVNGTSFATPVVSAAAAILMQEGIVKGRDPYLYGERLKALLRKGTKSGRGLEIPSDTLGYGFLCLESVLE